MLTDAAKIEMMHSDINQLQEKVKTIDQLLKEIGALRAATRPLLDTLRVQPDGRVELSTNLSLVNGADIMLE
jgi:hypothetical protein